MIARVIAPGRDPACALTDEQFHRIKAYAIRVHRRHAIYGLPLTGWPE